MTMRCSRCDIAHEETSRCPTDLEYERGYRAGLDQAKITIAEREKHLSAAECSNVSLRQRLAAAEALLLTACDAWECGQMVTGRDGIVLADYKAACLPRAWYEAAKGGRE